jgi:uncharacterized protein
MPSFIEVTIDSVRVSLTNQQRIVILREVNAERYLPIWIGPYEAESITIALQEIEVARPQTHDLIKTTLQTLNAQLLRVEVTSLRNDVFFGNLVVEVDEKVLNIDSRPSDALALAIRMHAPIWVEREVMLSAGIVPEQDLSSSEPSPSASTADADKTVPIEEISEDRLSVFEDFLQNIDLDKKDDTDEKDSSDDQDKPDPQA